MNDASHVGTPRMRPLPGGSLAAFLYWYAAIAPGDLLAIWKNYLAANLNYFSMGLLLRTLLSPWHRTTEEYRNNGHLMDYVEAAVFNAVSRIVGLIIRLATISIGLIIELAILVLGPLALIAWFALPLALAAALFVSPASPPLHQLLPHALR